MAVLPPPINHLTDAIYSALAKRANHSDSRGVPAGSVGEECERKLWYALRWANKTEEITGQKQRRFGTGLREEERLLNDLEAAGITVERVDPTTGQQFRVELANGWLRGRIDGRASNLPEAPKTVHVVETKSHNDRSFKDLIKKKLKDAKPEHYAQCQSYMHALSLTRCLYLAVNKNTDELYSERIEYDASFALILEAKVARLVSINRAPAKLHDDPTAKARSSAISVQHFQFAMKAHGRAGTAGRASLLHWSRTQRFAAHSKTNSCLTMNSKKAVPIIGSCHH